MTDSLRARGTLLLVISVFLLLAGELVAQCLSPELAMINACVDHPNPNGSMLRVEAEMLIIRSGLVEVPVQEAGFDLPFNGFGPENGDLGFDVDGTMFPCNFKEPTVTSLSGCGQVIPLGPSDTIPPDATIVVFITGTTVTADMLDTDFSNLCRTGQPVYILQSACERSAGAFANGPGAGDPLRTITVSSPCGLRSFTYNTQELDPNEGTYFLVGPSEVGNLDCDLPTIPATCPGIDTTFSLCGYGGQVDPPVTVDLFREIFPATILTVSFHPTPGAAETNTSELNEYSGSTANPDTLYTRIVYADNLCVAVGRFYLNFPADVITATAPAEPVRGCDPDRDGTGLFDLNRQEAEVGGGQPVTWFTDAAATDQIMDPAAFSSGVDTIYAVAGLGTCQGNPVAIPLALIDGPDAAALIEDTTCPENEDGAISFTTLGFEPFYYDWSGEAFDGQATRTGLAAAEYRVTITDRYGCEDRRRPRVQQGLTLELGCEVLQAASGSMAADGSVRLMFTEGRPPFELAYAGADAGTMQVVTPGIDLTGLRPGIYTFVATDADGCASESCTLEIPASPPITLNCTVRNNTDGGAILGAINFTVSGGAAPFRYVLEDGNGGMTVRTNQSAGNHVFTGLPEGNYTITVTDANGATTSCSRMIATVPCPLRIVSVEQLATDCSGMNNTIIRLTIAGNSGAINTMWTGDNNVEQFDGQQEAGPLPPGIYFVAVTDQSGCPDVVEGPITVTDPGQINYQVSGNFMTSPCQDDGSFVVTDLIGGTAPYSIVLFDLDTGVEIDRRAGLSSGDTATFSGLSGGPGSPTYTVYVADDLGCQSNQTFIPITAAPAPMITLPAADQQIVAPVCAGGHTGSLSLMAAGGTAPYTYRWVDYPEIATRILSNGPSQTALPAGDYLIEIADANGCLDTALLVLPDGMSPTLSCGELVAAVGTTPGQGSVMISNGTAPYLLTLTNMGMEQTYPGLTGGTDTLPDLPAGDYSAVVTDNEGCSSATCFFTITQLGCAVSLSVVTDTISCGGATPGQFTLTPAGGAGPYTFDWAAAALPDQGQVTITQAGNYPVAITDANGCRLDTTLIMPVLANSPTLSFAPERRLVACFPGPVGIPIRATGTGPFRVEYTVEYAGEAPATQPLLTVNPVDTIWVDFSATTPDSATVAIVGVENDNCTTAYAEMYTLIVNRPDTVRRFETTCDPGPIEIGGRFFDAMSPADTFLVADGSGCGVVYEVDLTFRSSLLPDTSIVFACPATPYEENGEVFDASRPEGEVVYTRPGQCDSVVYVRLDIAPSFLGSYGESACVGDTIFYGDRFFTAEAPDGIARFPGMAASGCDSLVVVINSFRRTGELRLFGDFTVCPGEMIELRFAYDGPGGIDALLTDAAGNLTQLNNVRHGDRVAFTPTESTTYRLLSSGIGGCPGTVSGSASVVINDLEATAEVLVNPGDFCRDTLGRAVVNYSGGVPPYAVAWSNGPTDSLNRNLLAGTYAYTVSDNLGCQLIDSVVLMPRVPLTAQVTGLPPVCPGEMGRVRIDTIFGGGGFYEVSLDGVFFLPVENVADFQVPPGLSRLTFQDADDCSLNVTFFVPDTDDARFNLPTDTTIFLGDSLLLDPRIILPLDTAWWTPAAGLRTLNQLTTIAAPLSSVNYVLHLRTAAQCEFTQTVAVLVDERLPLYVPTAFSPNGDGVNDQFELQYNGRIREVRSFQIFNRWGTMVHDGENGWDGSLNGRPAQVGVYVYQAVVLLADGSERLVKGDLVLMR